MNLLIDIWQQGKIADAQKTASAAVDSAKESKEDAQSLRRKIDALALANQALFEILAERLGIKERDVVRRMVEIDQRDGRKDGKMGGAPLPCRKCGRTTNTAQKYCVYCGEPVTDGNLFQKI
jgi:predicted Zn-ribbon and HTH transcriptional regulator